METPHNGLNLIARLLFLYIQTVHEWNKWCLKATILHYKAILGRGQPELMRSISCTNHDPGAESLALTC